LASQAEEVVRQVGEGSSPERLLPVKGEYSLQRDEYSDQQDEPQTQAKKVNLERNR